MKYTKESIEQLIKDVVYDVSGVEVTPSTSLIDPEVSIVSADFLYIFDILEKELDTSICKIFENASYDIMIVENLSNAIVNLIADSRVKKCLAL